ncbi:hypothetical protein FRC02_001585 [Tulasnella sp. 418]|nr:hypothetical protein FRC02_001585 [Tulasnella sp. 418]
MGALYLASKLEECPIRMRDLINVYDLLLSRAKFSAQGQPADSFIYEPMSYYSETYYDLKDALVVAEMQILKRLGFNVQVQLPFGTMVNYLQVLLLTERDDVAQKAWNYLNDALQTPVYAVYPPSTIAAACIFLTCRQLAVSLPSEADQPWWELFDANLEDIMSICGYIQRLYRPRTEGEKDLVTKLVTKKELRKWLEDKKP